MIFQNSLGIEIREDSIFLVYLKGSFRDVQIEAHGAYPIDRPLSEKEKLTFLINTIQSFLQQNKIESTDIYLGIPRDQAIFRVIEFPVAVKENLRSTLLYEIDKYLPLSPENIVFDFQLLDVDKNKNTLKVLLVVVKKKDFAVWIELQDRLGRGVSGIELCSTALNNCFDIQQQLKDNATMAFLLSQPDRFEVGLMRNRLLIYSKVVPITESGADRLEIVVKELAELSKMGERPEGLIILGEGIPPIDYGRLQSASNLSVRALTDTKLQLPEDRFAAAFGLAVKGLKKVPMQINLLAPELRKRPGKTVTYVMIALLFLVLASGAAWAGGHFLRQKMYSRGLESELARLAGKVKAIDRTKEELKTIEDRIALLDGRERDRPLMLKVLKEVSSTIPDTAWINDFSMTGKSIRMTGYAETATQLISILEGSPILKNVVFLSTISKGKDGKEAFQIGMEVE